MGSNVRGVEFLSLFGCTHSHLHEGFVFVDPGLDGIGSFRFP